MTDVTGAVSRWVQAAALALLVAAPAWATEFEEGLAAADRGDYALAMRRWKPLAEQGYAAAQFNVAVLYQNGWGTPKDLGEAIMWYWSSAAQGDVNAQYNLAQMYADGEGMPPTPIEAYAWFDVAHRGGHADAAAARDAVAATLDREQREQARLLAKVLREKYLGR